MGRAWNSSAAIYVRSKLHAKMKVNYCIEAWIFFSTNEMHSDARRLVEIVQYMGNN